MREDETRQIGKTFYDPELVTEAFKDIQAFGIRLEGAPTKTPWFHNLLCGLLSALLRQHHNISLGLRESTPLLAWGCRNTLELNICTKYALLGGNYAKSFVDDMWIDGLEVFSGFRSWLRFRGVQVSTVELDAIITNLKAGKAEHGVTRSTPLRMRSMAEMVGFSEAFRNFNKLSSKLLHQTAYSVLLLGDRDERALRQVLFDYAVQFAVEAFSGIQHHVDENGVEPPKDGV